MVAYIADNSASSTTAITYGWPINSWCVGKITDMSNLFQNRKFNEDIGQWDVSNVGDMGNMFAYASSYDWSKGHEFNHPQHPKKIYLHKVYIIHFFVIRKSLFINIAL